jgi:hypothetical protein
MQNMRAEMGLLREKAEKDRADARAALASAAKAMEENRHLREANPDAVALLESSCAHPLSCAAPSLFTFRLHRHKLLELSTKVHVE